MDTWQLPQGEHNMEMSPLHKLACLFGNTAMHVLPCCFAKFFYTLFFKQK